jgi:hypothetical protein
MSIDYKNTINLPKTALPNSRELVAFAEVGMAFGERHLFGPLSFEVRGPERRSSRMSRRVWSARWRSTDYRNALNTFP